MRPNETAKVILELMETLGRSVLDGTEFQHADELQAVFDAAPVSTRDALVQLIRSLEAEREACEAAGACESICDDARPHRPMTTVEWIAQPRATDDAAACDPEFVVRSPGNHTRHFGFVPPPAAPEFPPHYYPAWSMNGWGMDRAVPPAPMAAAAARMSKSEDVAALRGTSEMLDQAAAGLEHRTLFEQADQLRELAQQLRQQARELGSRRAGRVADKWNEGALPGGVHFGR